MIRFVVSAALTGTLVLSSPALSVEPVNGASAPVEPTAKAPAKEKRICKRQEQDMGSRLAGKVCKTESEWKAEADAGRQRFQETDKD